MEKEIYIKKGWLFIPVCATYGELPFGGKKNNRMLEIFCRENNSETKLFEFQIPAGEAEDETYPVSYYARFPVKQFTDKTLILRGDLGRDFSSVSGTSSFLIPSKKAFPRSPLRMSVLSVNCFTGKRA